jgi:hypothetical protein
MNEQLTDQAAYEILARDNPGLLASIEALLVAITAKEVEQLMRQKLGQHSSVADLVIGAAYYLESQKEQ